MKKKRVEMAKLEELKDKMKDKRHSLRTLAPILGMRYNTLWKKLNGYSDVTSSEIFAICTELGIEEKDIGVYFFPRMFPKETLTA